MNRLLNTGIIKLSCLLLLAGQLQAQTLLRISDTLYHEQYYLLHKYLPFYDSLTHDRQEMIPATKKDISAGMQNVLVAQVRRRLMQERYKVSEPLKADSFDASLREALIVFQRNMGCEPNGNIDEQTISAMNVPYRERLTQIRLNIERWKLIPPDSGQCYIVVNIADFQLSLMNGGAEAVKMKVIAGRLYRKTPVIHSQLNQIVFNPEWAVPENIMLRDILPEILKDPDYLKKHKMHLYRYNKDGSREELDYTRIDWQRLSPPVPFIIVQEPGPWNALGSVKYLFPNPYHVYMHDTPVKNLFKAKEPAYSSGCIRLSEAMRLAEYLLAKEDAAWTKEKLDQVQNTGGSNYTVALKQQVPVFIDYFTAWVDKNGVLQFRRDVYDKDH